jgi:hypothetical protein
VRFFARTDRVRRLVSGHGVPRFRAGGHAAREVEQLGRASDQRPLTVDGDDDLTPLGNGRWSARASRSRPSAALRVRGVARAAIGAVIGAVNGRRASQRAPTRSRSGSSSRAAFPRWSTIVAATMLSPSIGPVEKNSSSRHVFVM